MKQLILAVLLSISSVSAMAAYETCQISNSDLPKEMVQKLKTDCEAARLAVIQKTEEEKKSGVDFVPTITPEKVTGWAQVAEGFANAMGAAARQLNVSVNEFIKTPAGLITIGVILWKVIGVSILKLLAMYAVFALCLGVLRTMWKVGSTPVEKSLFWAKWTKQKPVYSTWENASDTLCGMSFVVIVIGGIFEVTLLISLT